MKKLFWILALTFFLISCNNNSIAINILNNSLTFRDSVKIELKNNTNENYLFYFKRTRFDYFPNSKNTLIAEIDNNVTPVNVEISSDPLYILNEDGTYNDDDIKEMEKYRNLSAQNIVKLVPARSSVFFNMKLLDTLNEHGGKEYPFLEKDKSYKITLKMDLDSTLMERQELKNIKIKYKNRAKIFQGKLSSNTVDLK